MAEREFKVFEATQVGIRVYYQVLTILELVRMERQGINQPVLHGIQEVCER
jgi:hypothetical protein